MGFDEALFGRGQEPVEAVFEAFFNAVAGAVQQAKVVLPFRTPAGSRTVEQRSAERERIRTEIAELGRKRDAWVRAETERLEAEGRGDGFDQEVLEAIRSQAAEKGIRYE